MANPNIDVLGPPPSYDSVVYGSDGGSGAIPPGTNIPPPQYATGPSDYPTTPYTYPIPPNYPAYGNAPQTQYPTTYNTSQAQHTTIVCANQPPQTNPGVCRRFIIFVLFLVCFFIIVVITWNLFH